MLRICVSEHMREELEPLYQAAIQKFNNSQNNKYRDSGFDLFVPSSERHITKYGEQYTINHNVQCAVYDTNGNPMAYALYPRSSLSKTPLRMSNSVGVIDMGYRGNIMAKVDHIVQIDETYPIEQHSRLFQLCIPTFQPFTSVELVRSLDETERGAGGFGSTGR